MINKATDSYKYKKLESSNKRIAKNTLLLYFRMLLMMGISLYTVRIILDTLGPVDYGLYNVVGGVVTMFAFLSSTMASASQRFFSFELGRNDFVQLKKTFSMTMTIYIMIAVIILVLAETVGLWFLNNKMTIPAERITAANWIYQFSVLSFMMTMFTIPYNAAIIAHERMAVYAYVSIIEVVLKLLIVYVLLTFSFDKLKLYAVLTFLVTTLVTFIYRTYCIMKFKECKFSFYWDKALFKEIISYSGWNLFGSTAFILKNQGVNVMLNLFFSPVINAAYGVASQVNTNTNQFISNFTKAVNPQITKYYASGQHKKMIKLVFQSAKFSYFLFFMFSMPILLETDFILSLWLKQTPDHVIIFIRLVIINALIDSLSNPIITVALATGKIRIYQIVVGGLVMLILPICYILLKLGFPPEATMVVGIVISIINLFVRLIILKKLMNFPIASFISKILGTILFVSLIAYIIPLYLALNMKVDGLMRFMLITASGFVSSLIMIWLIGFSSDEKAFIRNLFYSRFSSTYHKKANNDDQDI